MQPVKISVLIALLAVLIPKFGQAQTDSLSIEVGTWLTGSNEDFMPLWAFSNRYGVISDRSSDASVFFRGMYEKKVNSDFSFSFGAGAFLNEGFENPFVNELYGKANFRKWQFAAGRFREQIGMVNHELSSGSLALSGNAQPLTKISIKTTDFVDVPFTNGWVSFKGMYGHAWFDNERTVQDALLHEKSFHLKFGKGNFEVYGGVNHFVMWSGVSPEWGAFPNGFSDYIRIVSGMLPSEDGTGTALDTENRLGNQLGTIDLGVSFTIDSVAKVSVYNQTPVEDGSGFSPINNKDRLLGLSFELVPSTDKTPIINGFTVEYINTKTTFLGTSHNNMDNYYNHNAYRTGWVNQGLIMGSPLFITQQRASNFFGDEFKFRDYNIRNNRISAWHFGLSGMLGGKISHKHFVTLTQNYGNTGEDDLFAEGLSQTYLMHEFSTTFSQRVNVTLAVGHDYGDLYNSIGGALRLAYRFNKAW